MDLLIKHGTWLIVPAGLALAFIFLHVFPKVYPFWVARALDEEDAFGQVPETGVAAARPEPEPSRAPAQPAKAGA